MTARSIFEADADDLRDRLDKALVAAESARKQLHDATSRTRKLVGIAKSACDLLDGAGCARTAEHLRELIEEALR